MLSTHLLQIIYTAHHSLRTCFQCRSQNSVFRPQLMHLHLHLRHLRLERHQLIYLLLHLLHLPVHPLYRWQIFASLFETIARFASHRLQQLKRRPKRVVLVVCFAFLPHHQHLCMLSNTCAQVSFVWARAAQLFCG